MSCALALGRDCRVFEKEERPGGLCRTDFKAGFTIDHSGHYLHFRDSAIRTLVSGLLGNNLISKRRDSWVRLNGVETPYPFQANLRGQPPAVIRECVLGIVRAAEAGKNSGRMEFAMRNAALRPGPAASYGDWIRAVYGTGFARHFMVPFNEKQFMTSVDRLVPEQGGRFLPRPRLTDVIRGAVGAQRGTFGYNALVSHPRRGGIEALARAMAARLDVPVEAKTAIERVLWKERSVLLSDGKKVPYDVLVSTMPLPGLLGMLDPAPVATEAVRRKLRWTGTLTIHFCVRRPRERRRHWFYVPERRFPFYRYGFPSNINPGTAPRGHGIVSAEVSYLPGRRPSDPQVVRTCARGLRALRVLGSPADTVLTMVADYPVSYVIFDRNRAGARGTALRFLARHGIVSTGRYGNWTYGGMEDAIKDGRTTAAAIMAYGKKAPERIVSAVMRPAAGV
jgi:protoporphyrinogen oxidase